MKKITTNEIIFLKKYIGNKNAKILDVMCGYGRLGNQLTKEGYTNIVGIDMDEYPFIPEKKQFKFIKGNFYEINLNDYYDYCYSIYNSYPNLDVFMNTINHCERILEKNGILIIDIFGKSEAIKRLLEQIIDINLRTLLGTINDNDLSEQKYSMYNLRFADINSIIDEEMNMYNLTKEEEDKNNGVRSKILLPKRRI